MITRHFSSCFLSMETPFVTPIFTTMIDVEGALDAVLEHKAKNQTGACVSNVGGWQSEALQNEKIVELEAIASATRNLLDPVFSMYGLNRSPVVDNYWANVSSKENFNISHVHALSTFSAVVYLCAPEGSGALVLERPDLLEHYMAPVVDTEINYRTYKVLPKNGLVVFFPSYLKHHVLPSSFDDKKVRVSLALNFF